MSTQANFTLRGRNPDVLTCIANLSNDEVFTPPEFANRMLDTLAEAWAANHNGANIWADKTVKFLDPFTKSGVFLREITTRLIAGLEKEIPDLEKRVNHILTKQVYGIAITQLTSLLARRSVYCSKHALGEHSIANGFASDDGNIWFQRMEHTWVGDKCKYCGAGKSIFDRAEGLESHAYAFIHTDNIKTRISEIFGEKNMQFDVIIGNPPYQLSDAGESTGSSPIYHLFVEAAKKVEPRFISMVIPARWFAGGKGLDEFRNTMLKDNRLSQIADFPVASDVFPGVKVNGGICYFLWEKDRKGLCKVTTTMKGFEDMSERKLDQFDTFVRFNQAIPILEKILAKNYGSLSGQVSRQKPFGLRTFSRPTGKGGITLYANNSVGKIQKEEITNGQDIINSWKVITSMGYGEGGEGRDYPRMIIGKPIVTGPPSACTETYIVVGAYETQVEAENLARYLRTRFLRFLVALRKNTQHVTQDRFLFVPSLPMTEEWTDEKLYGHFGITTEEVDFIEKIVRPMELTGTPDDDA